MYCENCKKEIQSGLKICNNCGFIVNKKNNLDLEKIRKNLKDIGNSFYLIGLMVIIINLGLYLGSALGWNFLGLGLLVPDLFGLFLTIILAGIFAILGKRMKKVINLKMRLYFTLFLIFLLVVLVWLFMIGGQVGILFFFLIACVILVLILLGKIVKTEEFKNELLSSEYKVFKKRGFILIGLIIILFFLDLEVNLFNRKGNMLSKQEIINEIVKEMKFNNILPMNIDETTMWVDISAQPNAVRYHLISSNSIMNDINNNIFKKDLNLKICQDDYLRSLLDSNITIEYLYVFENTDQEYFISFSKEDCLR
jgi:hypothetical protein